MHDLSEFGWSGSKERQQAIAEGLVADKVFHWKQLLSSRVLQCCTGFKSYSAEEVAVLERIVARNMRDRGGLCPAG